MPAAHLYIFSDACPTDWLEVGHEERWHTIANFVFQVDPAIVVEKGASHEVILHQDSKFCELVADLKDHLPSGQLRKWKTGLGYRARFCTAFAAVVKKHRPLLSACSFQEQTLRGSLPALLGAYNLRLGGVEGRGIGFETFTDDKGREQMKHSFLNSFGYYEIQAPVNQMLVLLFMSWFVADQYAFYYQDIVRSGKYGFDDLSLSVVSDKLSGDDDFRRKSEQNLRNLLDPERADSPIVLTRSPASDMFSADLIVDNLAGWLTAAMIEPAGEFANYARNLIDSGVWAGWHQLLPSTTKLTSRAAVSRLHDA